MTSDGENGVVDTFVIRLWRPADPAAATGDGPRGVVRHVATGRIAVFRDGPELLAHLRELRGQGDDGPLAGRGVPHVEPA